MESAAMRLQPDKENSGLSEAEWTSPEADRLRIDAWLRLAAEHDAREALGQVGTLAGCALAIEDDSDSESPDSGNV